MSRAINRDAPQTVSPSKRHLFWWPFCQESAAFWPPSAGILIYRHTMPSRIVHYVHRPKRPPRKHKAAPAVPAIVTRATRRTPIDTPPVADEPEPPPPANDDGPPEPAPPAARSAVVTTAKRRGRLAKLIRELPDDTEADARVKAFFARMIRPP